MLGIAGPITKWHSTHWSAELLWCWWHTITIVVAITATIKRTGTRIRRIWFQSGIGKAWYEPLLLRGAKNYIVLHPRCSAVYIRGFEIRYDAEFERGFR
jgi:O-antigen ligase